MMTIVELSHHWDYKPMLADNNALPCHHHRGADRGLLIDDGSMHAGDPSAHQSVVYSSCTSSKAHQTCHNRIALVCMHDHIGQYSRTEIPLRSLIDILVLLYNCCSYRCFYPSIAWSSRAMQCHSWGQASARI